MGRPKKYTDDYIDKLGNEMLEWFKDPKEFWLKDFAIKNGFPSQLFSVFAEKSDKFSEALKKAKDIQESKLVRMGFNKKFNCAMAIFALKNVSGWRDMLEQKNQLSDEETQEVKRLIRDNTSNNI